MFKKFLSIQLLAILTLTGCATVNNATGAAALSIKTLAETTREECGAKSPEPCVSTSAISSEERDRIKVVLTEAQTHLEDANSIRKGGIGQTCTQFHDCLAMTHSLLSAVEALLERR